MDVVLFVYLGVVTLIPSLVRLGDHRGLGRRRGLRRALVEAAPPIVHQNLEHDEGIQVVDEVRRLGRTVFSPLIVTMIYLSITSIIGRTPMEEVIRALVRLFSIVIQVKFMGVEVTAASCLDPGHSGTEGCILQS